MIYKFYNPDSGHPHLGKHPQGLINGGAKLEVFVSGESTSHSSAVRSDHTHWPRKQASSLINTVIGITLALSLGPVLEGVGSCVHTHTLSSRSLTLLGWGYASDVSPCRSAR